MLRILKYILITFFFAILGAYVFFAARLDARDRASVVCNNISVIILDSNSSGFLKRDDILAALKEKYGECTGTLIDDIDRNRIEEALMSMNALKSCECHTDMSGELFIEITQREPVLRIESGSGSYYCDEEGYIFPLHSSRTSKVPVITGDIPVSFDKLADGEPELEEEREWIDDMLKLNRFISSDSYWDKMFTQTVVKGNGEILLIPKTGCRYIEFGRPEDINRKFYLIKRYYDSIYPEKGEQYESFSVKYKDQIVCRKKDKKRK